MNRIDEQARLDSSATLHAALIALAAFGLPKLFEPELSTTPEPMVVGIVEIAEEASAPEVKPAPPAPPPTPKPDEVKPEPPPPPPEPQPEPQPAPEPPPPPPPPEPEPPPPEPEPPPPEPEPPPPEPEPPPPEPEPQAAVPKPPPKPDLPQPKPDLASLLKNLAKEAPAPPAEDTTKEAEKPRPELSELLNTVARAPEETPPDATPREPATPQLVGPLAATIAGAIQRKVEENWSVPAGVEGADSLLVALTLELAPDGSVRAVDIDDYARYGVDAAFRTMAESAKRAVLKASPFEILRSHADKYDQWRVISMTFRPPV